MIAIRPGFVAFTALALIVDCPGELDTDALAAHLWPPPRLSGPLTTREAWKAWADTKAAHRTAAAAKASRLLNRLVTAGLVDHRAPPRVSAWFLARVEQHGLEAALDRVRPSWPRDGGDLRAHLALLRVVEGAPSSRAVLGESPSGHRKRAWADLCAWGVVAAPSQRWPTAAGAALVAGHRSAA